MSQEAFMQIARYDGLTGLPNRIFFNEVLNKALSYAKRRKKILAVLIIDLRSFKKINAAYGNLVGDSVLKEMGKRFAEALRAEDVLAKLAGDQFVVLLNDIDKPKFASTVAEKILKTCESPVKVESHQIPISVSIGIAVYPHDGETLKDLLINSDAALYRAKIAGEGVYQFHAQEMNVEAREFIQMGTALQQALQNKELVLYYQPKLQVKLGKITSVEALIRWVHPKLGVLTPDKFIPVAEETGLIMLVGEWVLREVCRVNKHWQDEGYGHLTVSINLSPKQFYHPDFPKMLGAILKETQLNPNYLEFEINESTVMSDIDMAAEILEKIKAEGVKISLDHFGAGCTSVSHLKKFPVSVVKIDPMYIRGTPYVPNDTAITAAFIGLAHNLGLEVVAEGVETAEQVEYLAAQNCDFIQGYFLSHPVPEEKIILHFSKLADDVLF
jgi:diguanylate cyclase (GGDEF)-like protein